MFRFLFIFFVLNACIASLWSDNFEFKRFEQTSEFFKRYATHQEPYIPSCCYILCNDEEDIKRAYKVLYSDCKIKVNCYGNFTGDLSDFELKEDDEEIEDKYETSFVGEYETYSFEKVFSENGYLICEKEDDGLTKTYSEEFSSLSCFFSKNDGPIQLREFVEYDDVEEYLEVIIDNGSSENKDNLTNVTERKKFIIKYCDDEFSDFCESCIKSIHVFNVDIVTGNEILTKIVDYTFVNETKQKEIYDLATQTKLYEVFDQNGNIILKKDVQGKATNFIYNSENQMIRSFNDDTMSFYFYNKKDQLYHIFHLNTLSLESYSEDFEYDEIGERALHKDIYGNITLTECNSRGQPLEITYPDGSIEQFRYKLNGHLSEKIDKDRNIIVYETDLFGRIIKEKIHDSDQNLINTIEHKFKAFEGIPDFNFLKEVREFFHENV